MADDSDSEFAGFPPGWSSNTSVLDPPKKDLSFSGSLPYGQVPTSRLDVTKPAVEPDAEPEGKSKVTPEERSTALEPSGRFGDTTLLPAATVVGTEQKPKEQEPNAVVAAHRNYDEANRKYGETEQQIIKILHDQSQSQQPAPQVTPMDYQGFLQRYDAQQRQQFKSSTLSFLAIAIPLAAAFGIFGRGGVWGALGALGEGMTALVKGHEQASKQKFEEFEKYAKYSEDLSKEKVRQYEQVLRDQRYSTNEKLRYLHELAGLYKDERAQSIKSLDEWIKNINGKNTLLGRYSRVTNNVLKTLAPEKQEEARVEGVIGNKPDQKDRDYRRHIMSKYNFDPWKSADDYARAQKLQSIDDALKEIAGEKSEETTKGRKKGEDESETDSTTTDTGKKNPAGLNLPGFASPSPSPTPSSDSAARDLGLGG